MGLPSSGISSTDGAPLVYVASESTALNTWFQSLESCDCNEDICVNSDIKCGFGWISLERLWSVMSGSDQKTGPRHWTDRPDQEERIARPDG